MADSIMYNPLNPFQGPTAAADPPPAYTDYLKQSNSTTLSIDNPAFPGSSVYRPTTQSSKHSTELIINGQGTVAVSVPPTPNGFLHMYIKVPSPGLPLSRGLLLSVTPDSCGIWWVDENGGIHKFDKSVITEKKPRKDGWLKEYEANYWLSLDLPHGCIQYGIGLFTIKSVVFQVKLKSENAQGRWIWSEGWDWLQQLKQVKVFTPETSQLATTPLSIVSDLPPLIRSSNQMSLDDLASGQFTVPENLPDECQKLYHNIAGPAFTLDTPDFPDFSSAIEYSVNTQGAYGYNLLESKHQTKPGEKKLSSDPRGTYLRITIGDNLGDSPGIPYVLEIWPAGHFSPVHDHGKAYAVIRVLHGSIECTYYDSLQASPQPNPLFPNPTILNKNDVTWLSPKIYQIHRLRNLSTEGKVCCTIQCYQYGETDTTHRETFWFKSEGSQPLDKPEEFPPNSDADFITFKETIREEWKRVLSGKTGIPFMPTISFEAITTASFTQKPVLGPKDVLNKFKDW
ncbi:hypothetical protein GYMLUDRAFT_77852 [Collybiopsis luxurians FD-317 M1]|uniref:Cysteine dioxygenase n=1 Tax=Collybiopsis luxurians FD-317 M1 TaxID=944289 RepID=A0A0D0BCW5_9AGAR|nr:hypothetical protein GYMLUDRAFT_77852 [Collybiopsis luxurians FD-317 M1]